MNGAWTELEQYCRVTRVQATDLLQLYMDNLKSGSYYRIELRAHNAMGFSQVRPLMLKTAPGELASDNYVSMLEGASFVSSSPVSRPAAAVVVLMGVLVKFVLSE